MSLSLGICEIYTPEIHGYSHSSIHNQMLGHYIVANTLNISEFYDDSYLDIIYTNRWGWRNAITNGYINKNFVHPVIANFKGMLRQEDFIKVDIIQSINLGGGEIIGIKKTMWLRIFQKIYKKRFLQQKQRIMLRKRPSSQHYRKLTGKYPK